MNTIDELKHGFETAFIDANITSNLAYKPQFVSNNYKEGKKVLASIEEELLACDCFQISVAFITLSGIEPLLQTLKELENKHVPGQILTTNYLNFTEPKALKKLNEFENITLKMYDIDDAHGGFHTKGYIFKKEEIYRIIIGSSNMTKSALTVNREWNTKVISTEQGEMAQEIISEYEALWNSEYAIEFDDFYEKYKEQYEIIKQQKQIAKQEPVTSLEKYKLHPNKMQLAFISNLRQIVGAGQERALLISATGTGKTYASAFAMRELGFRRVLFLVHRSQLARQTKKAYQNVFSKSVSMGLVGTGNAEYDKDYVFATVQTLNKDQNLKKYSPDSFDCIILDEAHHSSANTYQKIMHYFTPKLWLGMTATPDKRDDEIEGRNIYEIFHHQIAYEIRLQQAMEEDMLCAFHYFGISDISTLDEKQLAKAKIGDRDFNNLTSDERVQHIVEQANFYGYSGERVKGLIFCSRIDESEELSNKFNQVINPETGKRYKTLALNGTATEEERQHAFERLAMNEGDSEEEPLDYIFSVEILNEGVDIVEVNQVIMLRPTQSPIVFIQQLGRGLRKAEGKEFVVILDFIGNYKNNFMIPIALSGDRTYNADNIRKYVISGNNIIPGGSTVHFDEIAKQKIFASIDKIKGIRSTIKESYCSLKNRLGRVPYLFDFYENGEIDPLVIIKEYKTYQNFLEYMEKELYVGKVAEKEKIILEYLSKTILSGVRPYELEILRREIRTGNLNIGEFCKDFEEKYQFSIDEKSFYNAIDVLQGRFVGKDDEYKKYSDMDLIVLADGDNSLKKSACLSYEFRKRLRHSEFSKQVDDIISVGLKRYSDKYATVDGTPFVLYEKYSRRDVSFLMNCGKDLSSTMYGMKRIGEDVFIFVTYHKEKVSDEKTYVDGKPDYADAFEDNMIFRWDTQIGRGIESSYVKDVCNAKRKHLFVKKSDAETNFYYMGQFDIMEKKAAKKKDNKGKERDIVKIRTKMHHPVREDLLRYLQSDIYTEKE